MMNRRSRLAVIAGMMATMHPEYVGGEPVKTGKRFRASLDFDYEPKNLPPKHSTYGKKQRSKKQRRKHTAPLGER